MPCTKALREIHIMGSKAFQETTVCINFQKLEHGTYRSGRVSHQFLRQLGSAMKRGHQTMDFPINHFRQTHIILRSVDDGVPEMKTPHPPYIWADYIKFGAIARPHFVTKTDIDTKLQASCKFSSRLVKNKLSYNILTQGMSSKHVINITRQHYFRRHFAAWALIFLVVPKSFSSMWWINLLDPSE